MAKHVDVSQIDPVLEKWANHDGALIPVLQEVQGIYGYLPEEALLKVADALNVPMSSIYGVATFYSQFYLTRRGRHIVRQCDGTACHVRGAAKIVDAIEKELGIRAGETTPDYRATYEVVYCLGSCGLAPVAVVDGNVTGKLVPERMLGLVRGLE